MNDVQLLMVEQAASAGPSPDTLFGGAPSVGEDFTWPTCASCSGNMRFLGQIRRPDASRLLLIFMCENDPGMCDDWDAEGGGNAVVAVVADGLHLAAIPAEGEVERPRYGARVEIMKADGYDKARGLWVEQNPERRGREVLGQIGGTPGWLQADETPSCAGCDTPMTFVAQLEQGPDHRTEMNFGGGGCGYVFDCDCARATPKFLWQS
jgi:hypothetical protein